MAFYKCNLVRVVDGDTVDIDIDLGFGVVLENRRVRLNAIDAPEKRTRNQYEKQMGNLVSDYVEKILKESETIWLSVVDDQTGKYGRIIGDFMLDEITSLCDHLVEAGYVINYDTSISKEAKLELYKELYRDKL